MSTSFPLLSVVNVKMWSRTNSNTSLLFTSYKYKRSQVPDSRASRRCVQFLVDSDAHWSDIGPQTWPKAEPRCQSLPAGMLQISKAATRPELPVHGCVFGFLSRLRLIHEEYFGQMLPPSSHVFFTPFFTSTAWLNIEYHNVLFCSSFKSFSTEDVSSRKLVSKTSFIPEKAIWLPCSRLHPPSCH